MNAKQKIIMFMTHKDRMISPHLGEGGIRYFTEEDEKDIQKWSDSLCEKVWEDVRRAVIVYGEKGLSSLVCPYCVIHWPVCHTCLYAKRHGECRNTDSDFCSILVELSFDVADKIFSNDYYVQLIIDLSREDEDGITKP